MAEGIDPKDAYRQLKGGLLVIQTVHPETVKELLVRYDLANATRFEEHQAGYVSVRCDDWTLMSLALWFWLHAAQGCGLITRWLQ